ncbi:Sulfatase-modifying factor enzyme 1 [Ulvibacter litoralis]|uniref:Sulfatase-modifying factor enzyme 1 n=2 Tax=Ulvibacter litoralis TaxID=227084 RepID=A0A1G7K494_9FLAO|nr:Sulfatase-modifying factor enzyme 1 [Ulvibacter litoralis]
MRKYNYLYNTKEFQLDSRSKTLKNKIKCTDATCSVKVFGPNIYGLFDTIGNVSELISHDGLAKGGNWKNELADNQIEKDLPFEGPNAWTGFRNIASQKLFSVRNGS